MCGIAGLLHTAGDIGPEELRATATAMAEPLAHRGPDDAGTFVDERFGLALGFRRLAVVDLSEAGHQPMTSASGRYALVFNGEIYNHQQLRAELPRVDWRGHSDTEVILACFDRWGIQDATRRFNGMFAFAVWDRERTTLTLARDRMGEKPLYYGQIDGCVYFGSELKALRAAPGFHADLDRGALSLFLRHGYIPSPYSVYAGVSKLPPAHTVEMSLQGVGVPTPYWSALEASERGLDAPLNDPEPVLVERLDALLRDAVHLRMEADVPLGAFLSGGIDSSLVVALMQAQSTEPVRTFTVGFTEVGYDEAPHAKAVAAHLGTSHTELYVSPSEARDVIPRLPTIYDEPFSDSSQIPTFLVSALARRDVTVSLSGDGGDELFGGYPRYLLLEELTRRMGLLPRAVRRAGASLITQVSAPRWDQIFRGLGPVLPARARQQHPGDKLYKLARALGRDGTRETYRAMVSLWDDPASCVVDGYEPPTPLSEGQGTLDLSSPALWAMHLDAITYLPDDILVKVDRAAMAVSLETRVPLLDHRVYEFAWQLPRSQRIRGGVGKHLLRRVLDRYVPPVLTDRPKMGFGVPIGDWLRGPLREWADDLLSPAQLASQGVLRPEPIQRAWQAHRTGTSDEKYKLWAVLMLQSWLAEHA